MLKTLTHFARKQVILPLTLVAGFAASPLVDADEINVAVAANFTAAAKELSAKFEQETGHDVKLSFASTGKIYAQITQGAPFDIFLAADAARPEKLVDEKLAVADSRFTYAVGQLALWSNDPTLVDDKGEVLKSAALTKLAIANPKTAPYCAAAVEALKNLGEWDALQLRIVQGNNIGQTYQLAKSGAAPAALVARAQIALSKDSSSWAVPTDLYSPIRQQGVLLSASSDNKAAQDFLTFLKSAEGHEIISRYGYGFE